MFPECQRLFVLGWLILALGLQGCEFPSDPQVRRVSIVLRAEDQAEEAFSPNPIHVPWAGKVVWINEDNFPHSVVAEAKFGPCAFQSEPIGPGKRFSKVFLKRGVCRYHCGIHGPLSMRGRVIVE
ncbi:MAG: plastocyanin/azurin family copper-binding protein [Nitrospiria bacterium]